MKLIIILILLPFSVLAEEQPQTYTVGVTAPLSGDFASYGEQIKRGVELARSDLERRNININVKYEDACLPATAVTAINKLIHIDKIQGLAANFCVIAMPAMSSLIQKNKIPSFHSAIASENILNLGGYVFTTDIKVRTEAKKLAEYAYNILNARTAGVLNIETDFGIDYQKYFSSRFEELGGKILYSESQPIGVNDFKSELTILKFKNPDVVLLAHLGLTLSTLLKQARQSGFKTQFLGTHEAEDKSVIEIAKDSADGLLFFVPEPEHKSNKIKNFEEGFFIRYGFRPYLVEASSYDSTTVLAESLAYCKGDAVCTKDHILKLKQYDGVSGHFSLIGSEESSRNFILKRIKSGKIEIVN